MSKADSRGPALKPSPGLEGEYRERGEADTFLSCTECSKSFVAKLDYEIDGNHIIECPWCGHEHCRVIIKGTVTDIRWDTRMQRVDVGKRNVWKSSVIAAKTSSASQFLADLWARKSR